MKLLFICGSLEAGRDGVGDYTRRLACECIRQGCECKIIAINDKFIRNSCEFESQWDQSTEIACLRLSNKTSWKYRIQDAKTWTQSFTPQFISLQFVPYSFHPKGLGVNLGRRLREVMQGARLHIMFHELWIGGGTLKDKIVGNLQRRILTFLPKAEVSHTHLPEYKKKLNSIGIHALPLPLFSNIPKLCSTESEIQKTHSDLGFFSQQSYANEIVALLKSIVNKSQSRKLRLHFTGQKGEKICKMYASELGGSCEYECHPYLSPEDVSRYLNSLDFGVTPVPRHGLGKSGSVAAFIEHGLPFFAPVVQSAELGFFASEYTDAKNLADLASNEAIFIEREYVSFEKIAETFMQDIERLCK